jgi:hypothetical protein
MRQEGNDEISKQIPMMDLIYDKATCTLVWPSAESEHSGLLMVRLASVKCKEDSEDISEAENEIIGYLFSTVVSAALSGPGVQSRQEGRVLL